MRGHGSWFGLGVALGIVAQETVVPVAPGTAAAIVALAGAAAIGNARAWVLIPPSLGLLRSAVTETAFRDRALSGPERIEGTFEVLREEGRGVVLRAGSRRLLLGDPPLEAASPGTCVRATLRADPVLGTADPSAFRADRWARTRGIHGRARLLGEAAPAGDAPGALAALRRAAHSFRGLARSRLGAGESDAGDLLTALLLGDRRGLDQDDRDAFRRSGLAHVLALSGMHVSILALGVGSLLRAVRLRGWAVLVVILAFLSAFTFVTGACSPILRSATTASLAAIATPLGRRFPPVHALGLAAGVLLLADPAALSDIGFRLSFAASWLLALAASRPIVKERGVRGLATGLGRAVAISATVTLGTLPDIASSFGTVSLLAPLTNLLAGPPSVAALGWGGLAVLVWPDAVGDAFASAARAASTALLLVARWSGPLPGGDVPMPAPGAALSIVAVAASGYLAAGRRPGRRTAFVLAGLVALAVAGRIPAERVTILDVGQGNAVLLEGGGSAALLDAGPPAWGTGPALAPRAVSHRGVGRLEVVVATHGHADHVGGLAEILARTEVRSLLAPMRESPGPETWSDAESVAERAGIPIAHPDGPPRPIVALGGRARIFSPWPEGRAPAGCDENELSLATTWRPRAGSATALFTGDLGVPGEAALLASPVPPLAATILLAGHHGSRWSTGDALLSAVRPRLVVISCGAVNTYGHPHPELLERRRERGAALLRTDRDGTVTITATRGGFRVRWERAFPGPMRTFRFRPERGSPTLQAKLSGEEKRCGSGSWRRGAEATSTRFSARRARPAARRRSSSSSPIAPGRRSSRRHGGPRFRSS
jgi:competence protein ComEC